MLPFILDVGTNVYPEKEPCAYVWLRTIGCGDSFDLVEEDCFGYKDILGSDSWGDLLGIGSYNHGCGDVDDVAYFLCENGLCPNQCFLVKFTFYPMFSTTTKLFGDKEILARVEWHVPDFNNEAVHRGVTLYQQLI